MQKLVLSSFYLLIVNNDILFEMLNYYICLQTVSSFYDSIRAGTPDLSLYPCLLCCIIVLTVDTITNDFYFYKSCDKGSAKDIGLKRTAITFDSPLVPLCEKNMYISVKLLIHSYSSILVFVIGAKMISLRRFF